MAVKKKLISKGVKCEQCDQMIGIKIRPFWENINIKAQFVSYNIYIKQLLKPKIDSTKACFEAAYLIENVTQKLYLKVAQNVVIFGLLHPFKNVPNLVTLMCETNEQESTKQLTVRQLPIVASFHLKRFEHSTRYQCVKELPLFVI